MLQAHPKLFEMPAKWGLAEKTRGEGDSPILLRRHRKIGAVPSRR
jgi:hypothetical protein